MSLTSHQERFEQMTLVTGPFGLKADKSVNYQAALENHLQFMKVQIKVLF